MTDEQKLIDDVNHAKSEVKRIKDLISALQIKRAEAETALEKAEQAYIAFMDECGVVESECGNTKAYITESERVDIQSIEAVPEEYIRTKVSKEPDKVKVKADADKLKGANWFTITKHRNLQLKATKGE